MKTPVVRRIAAAGSPFGSAGSDWLAAVGYAEEEHLLTAPLRRYASTEGAPRALASDADVTTRVLVRRPRAGGSGVVHVEPLHPHMDAGLTWEAAADAIVAAGDTWVGVTVYPAVAGMLRTTVDPERYGALEVPDGAEWGVMADALDLLRDGAFGVAARTVVLSGWSATGSFCRVFACEGFARGRVDGVVVFISSGGAGAAGYPPLSPGDRVLPPEHPRRTMRDVGVPVFEVLSETEAPSHRPHVRADSDAPCDAYRLYQIAGSAHVENWPQRRADNVDRLAAAGIDVSPVPVVGERTDARSDLVAHALLAAMAGWAAEGRRPPDGVRLDDDGEGADIRRDADGNALGGVRTPWLAVPLARYVPRAVPVPRSDPGGPSWTPLRDDALAASLVGVMERFPPARVRRDHADADAFARDVDAAVGALQEQGFLLPAGAAILREGAAARWRIAAGERP